MSARNWAAPGRVCQSPSKARLCTTTPGSLLAFAAVSSTASTLTLCMVSFQQAREIVAREPSGRLFAVARRSRGGQAGGAPGDHAAADAHHIDAASPRLAGGQRDAVTGATDERDRVLARQLLDTAGELMQRDPQRAGYHPGSPLRSLAD